MQNKKKKQQTFIFLPFQLENGGGGGKHVRTPNTWTHATIYCWQQASRTAATIQRLLGDTKPHIYHSQAMPIVANVCMHVCLQFVQTTKTYIYTYVVYRTYAPRTN